MPNATSTYAGIAEEQQAREAAAGGQIRILRRELPALLERLGQIPNPRNPKCRHRLTMLPLYGLLMFVFQFASRREVNREMIRPQFAANLKLLAPELVEKHQGYHYESRFSLLDRNAPSPVAFRPFYNVLIFCCALVARGPPGEVPDSAP